MRGKMAVAACLAVLGVAGFQISHVLADDAMPGQAATAAPTEALPSDTVLEAINAYETAVLTAGANLPKGLATTPGTDFFGAHIEAIANLDSPAAKIFARRMADVLTAHKIKLSDALAKLPELPADGASQPPLSRADSIQLAAIINQFLDPEKYPFQDTHEGVPYLALLKSLVETCALYAPSAAPRFKATTILCDTESLFNMGISPSPGEDLAHTWVTPALAAKAWDNTFSFMLDPANSDTKGKLDPAVGSLLNTFNNEIYTMYMVSHELAVDNPTADLLNGPLDTLINTAKKAQPAITDPADQELLTLFIAHIEILKKDGAGARTATYVARPAVVKLINDFVAAVNGNDHDAMAKVLTPGGAKGAAAVADLPSALFEKQPVKDIKVFFVSAPGLDGSMASEEKSRYRVIFYLQAADAKDNQARYVRLESIVTKSGDAWLLHEVNGVFAAAE